MEIWPKSGSDALDSDFGALYLNSLVYQDMHAHNGYVYCPKNFPVRVKLGRLVCMEMIRMISNFQLVIILHGC